MNAKSLEILKGLIAIVLLLIYLLTLGHIILETINWDPSRASLTFDGNILWVVNVTGGLVSAVIIANFAIAKPGETPLSQVERMSGDYGRNFMAVVVWIYVIIWLLIGLSAFMAGVIFHPEVFEPLNEIGKAWLGILLGIGYAWFGINRPPA